MDQHKKTTHNGSTQKNCTQHKTLLRHYKSLLILTASLLAASAALAVVMAATATMRWQNALSTRISHPNRDTACTIVELFESYEIVDAYLKEKGAQERVQTELDETVEVVRRVIMTPPTSSHTAIF